MMGETNLTPPPHSHLPRSVPSQTCSGGGYPAERCSKSKGLVLGRAAVLAAQDKGVLASRLLCGSSLLPQVWKSKLSDFVSHSPPPPVFPLFSSPCSPAELMLFQE